MTRLFEFLDLVPAQRFCEWLSNQGHTENCKPEYSFDDILGRGWGVDVSDELAGREEVLVAYEELNDLGDSAAAAREMERKMAQYHFLERLGEGASSIVSKEVLTVSAFGLPKNTVIAVKRYKKSMHKRDPHFDERIRREGTTDRLQHKNIIQVYGLDHDYRGDPILVMEYVEGGSLDDEISKGSNLTFEVRIEIATEICDGLTYLHENNVLHRDLKPANVLVTREYSAKLADFGVIKELTEETHTNKYAFLGTRRYASPDCVEHGSGKAKQADDIYSLGATLYHLFTGEQPFFDAPPNDAKLLDLLRNTPPKQPMQVSQQIPLWLDQLILTLMQKRADERQLTPSDVKSVLQDGQQSRWWVKYLENNFSYENAQHKENDGTPRAKCMECGAVILLTDHLLLLEGIWTDIAPGTMLPLRQGCKACDDHTAIFRVC